MGNPREEIEKIKEILNSIIKNKISIIKKMDSSDIEIMKEDIIKIIHMLNGIRLLVLTFEDKEISPRKVGHTTTKDANFYIKCPEYAPLANEYCKRKDCDNCPYRDLWYPRKGVELE